MSVNGDLAVVRNGRSTSQVSVYNYPEHLNPFYEDDNHKRLRFWKINKGTKDGQGRRNSFSLGGIKDMWAFKSFRMKKKSSSLGINKTSESPPPLRRDLFPQENGYGTYDPRMRYTTGATNNFNGDNAFERNAPYRSSLQDMRNAKQDPSYGIGFNRNDRYRSTIQTATTSGTSTSPTSQSLTLPATRRSSQASVASTNPFEDDDDDDVIIGAPTAASTPSKHPARKKRRAPPPPVPVHQIIREESSSAGSTPNHKPSSTQENESVEIHNLRTEIESFVNSLDSENIERDIPSSPNKITNTTTITTTTTSKEPLTSLKQNGTIPKIQTSPPASKSNGTVKTNAEIIVTSDAEPLLISQDHNVEVAIKNDSPIKIVEIPPTPPVKEIGHVEVIHVHVESPRSSPEKTPSTKLSTFRSEEYSHSAPEKTEPTRISTFRSEVKRESPEKNIQRSPPQKVVITTTAVKTVEVHQPSERAVDVVKIKDSPEKPRIAAKPNIPKSPNLSVASRDVSYPGNTPDTPAMRRREIKIETNPPSSPETNHRDVIIEAKRKEATIKVERITPEDLHRNKNEQTQPSSSDVPTPAIRDRKLSPSEQISPLPPARKVTNKENELNLSIKQEVKPVPIEKKIDVEEKISNLDVVIPVTVSDLQSRITETAENITQIDEPISDIPLVAENFQPSPESASSSQPAAASTSNARAVPIEKPPRTKHFTEEIPDNIYRPRPTQWKQSTLAPLEPIPPEKRRSVKQIIESINRSQRLLNGKKEDDTQIDVAGSQRNMSETNTNAMEQNLKSLAESQREMKRMLEELDGLENVNERKLSNKSDENFQGILDTIVSTLARETSKKNEVEIFKKCTITKEINNASRESSPTSSNLDWNPVPKPKRTKNRSPDLEVKKNNGNN